MQALPLSSVNWPRNNTRHFRSVSLWGVRREASAVAAAFAEGKREGERESRTRSLALAKDLAAADAASRVVAAEEMAAKTAAAAARTAAATGRPPFREIPCGPQRSAVAACYAHQQKASGESGVPLHARVLRCAGEVREFEACSQAETSALLRPGARA